ncbi:unnamed protein product [Acanthoscelides obtectus]|uniref:Uncharacterized protein n=1 Tax=Acanthoscelides obtectus TaxID=200917 RepID=A0A9P0K2E0_ACAOB|nr:unnamed protein product [Acanthoscelides obtectus]CAK1669590.1 IQ domain-containing protein K [Acanthoscelides obtectus]
MDGSVQESVATRTSHSIHKHNGTEITEADKIIWGEICCNYEKNVAKIEEYLKSKSCVSEIEPNPAVGFLTNHHVQPVLKTGLYEMLFKVADNDSYYVLKTAFDGIDFLSEYLYNMNPKYPERRLKWTNIFDMNWVKESLAEHPRPFFPFQRIWSRETAAKKIQAFMRAYWDRKKPDIQEVRLFWKDIDGKAP